MKKYGETIARLRKAKGLTQEQLGKMLNVSYQAVSKWENDLAQPSFETLEKMTEIFGITISDFFDLPNNLKPETKRNSSSVALWIKSNLHICVAIGLGIFVLVLALCAFLIPINYSSGEIYDKYKSSIFYLDMQGVMDGDATTKNGTGFFINNKGLGVTLYDNLKYCASGQVVLSNSDRFNIEKVVGIDEENNLALIQTDAQNTKYININYDKNVKLGDKVYCLAYSFDDGTKEHQSALAEGVIFKVELDSLGKSSQIQTTATIDDATSGGVVFNEHADAIAITLRDLVSYTDVVNVCIPVRIIKDIDRDVNLSLYDLAARDYSYTISFNSNGGNGYMAPQFIWQDEWTALYENVFTKDGYKFAGWQYNGRIYQDGEQVYNLGSVTLTATWELVSYGITYYLDGGENSSLNVNSFTVLNDEVILYEATKPGYIFINWYQDINCEGDAIHSINPQTLQNYTLYAKFEPINYKIYYVLNGAENDINNVTSYTIEDPNITLYSATKQGFIFKGWYLDENYTTQITQIDTSQMKDITLYPLFLSNNYVDGKLAIYTSYDLITMLENETTQDLILCNDIDLKGTNWVYNGNFYASFDGNNHTISNFIMENGSGFFGSVWRKQDGYIKNLTLSDFSFTTSSSTVGVLIGSASNSVIQNCRVIDGMIEVKRNSSISNAKIGCLVGSADNCEISECYSSINLLIDRDYRSSEVQVCVGGLIGDISGSTVANCYTTGNITYDLDEYYMSDNQYFIGGLVGNAKQNSLIYNCYSLGDISTWLYAGIRDTKYIGGLIGQLESNSKINGCYVQTNLEIHNYHSDDYNYNLIAVGDNEDITNCFTMSGSSIYWIEYGGSPYSNYEITEPSEEEILQYVYENWDGEVWNLSLADHPTLKD